MAMAVTHSAPPEHLPASLVCDGKRVAPTAATDLWARIISHNEWLKRAYTKRPGATAMRRALLM
jgi:hypothetical protein